MLVDCRLVPSTVSFTGAAAVSVFSAATAPVCDSSSRHHCGRRQRRSWPSLSAAAGPGADGDGGADSSSSARSAVGSSGGGGGAERVSGAAQHRCQSQLEVPESTRGAAHSEGGSQHRWRGRKTADADVSGNGSCAAEAEAWQTALALLRGGRIADAAAVLRTSGSSSSSSSGSAVQVATTDPTPVLNSSFNAGETPAAAQTVTASSTGSRASSCSGHRARSSSGGAGRSSGSGGGSSGAAHAAELCFACLDALTATSRARLKLQLQVELEERHREAAAAAAAAAAAPATAAVSLMETWAVDAELERGDAAAAAAAAVAVRAYRRLAEGGALPRFGAAARALPQGRPRAPSRAETLPDAPLEPCSARCAYMRTYSIGLIAVVVLCLSFLACRCSMQLERLLERLVGVPTRRLAPPRWPQILWGALIGAAAAAFVWAGTAAANESMLAARAVAFPDPEPAHTMREALGLGVGRYHGGGGGGGYAAGIHTPSRTVLWGSWWAMVALVLDRELLEGGLFRGGALLLVPGLAQRAAIHEAGHFYVAHLLGCAVTDFSVGGWTALQQGRSAAGGFTAVHDVQLSTAAAAAAAADNMPPSAAAATTGAPLTPWPAGTGTPNSPPGTVNGSPGVQRRGELGGSAGEGDSGGGLGSTSSPDAGAWRSSAAAGDKEGDWGGPTGDDYGALKRASVILMGGVAAEAVVLGSALGGLHDTEQLARLLRQLLPRVTPDEAQAWERWALAVACQLIQEGVSAPTSGPASYPLQGQMPPHDKVAVRVQGQATKGPFVRLLDAMRTGSGIGQCLKAVEGT